MPHCCPQKQQCVFTSFSAGWVDSSRQPPGGVNCWCGPNFSIRTSGDCGGLATSLLLQAKLGHRERLALARRTQLLPIAGRSRHRIVEAELRQNKLEVVNVHARGVALAAAGACRTFAFLPCFLVKLHAELRWTLEDVEEFSKRQIQ